MSLPPGQVPKRRYEDLWNAIIKEPGKRIRVQVKASGLMKRIRKAVWKEKSLDLNNREKFTLKCEMDVKVGAMTFWVVKTLSDEDV